MPDANPERLRSTIAKLKRASVHFKNLEQEMGRWIGSKPYDVAIDVDPSARKVMAKIKVNSEIPETIAPIMGDAIHNLRSALDHLAWALVDQSGGTPNQGTQFPISYNLESFENALPRNLSGASMEIMEAVKSLKPYKGTDEAPGDRILWTLHQLDIVDKHRLIVAAGAAHTKTEVRFARGMPLHKDFQWIGPPLIAANRTLKIPVENGDPIGEFVFDNWPLPPNLYLNGKPTFSIVFGEGYPVSFEKVTEVLTILGNHVQNVVLFFQKRFFE